MYHDMVSIIRTKYFYNPWRLEMRAKLLKLWSISKEWLFHSENCNAATVFGQKVAARLKEKLCQTMLQPKGTE